MPTRPEQNDPERVAAWERTRRAVGGNIRTLRTQQGMTQETLALASGVTRNVLIDVEHGRRGLLYERIVDIAEALGVRTGTLFGDK
ncbi:helix-turn-helix domain-containing protein [Mycobacteroides abscessus]|uniref:helix-turn-helix domain-containing protein n=1 Tax=Mycobacteroides abscessus TaxID=36809 RepID=UPI0009A55F84|nr:helix-turn-helix transcriptional regulator [Mycobacteroides abscessus]